MKNLLMDSDAMYPQGFHPVEIAYAADYSGYAKHVSRTAANVRYYFVDFGISVHIPDNLASKLVTGRLGRDRDPPELSPDWGRSRKRGNQDPSDSSAAAAEEDEGERGYDPFKLDVFIIGNMLKQEFQMVRIPPGAF